MKTLEIKKEDAKKAYAEAKKSEKQLLENLFGKDVFQEPINVIERIKTIENVLKDNNITQEEFDKKHEGFDEHFKAYSMLILICKSLNEG